MIDAKEYGRALFLLALETNSEKTLLDDLNALEAVLRENPDFTRLIDTPALTKAERLGIVDRSLSSLSEPAVNLVKILSERHLAYALTSAISGFYEAYDEHFGIERVEILSAIELTVAQTEKIKTKLEAITGKKIITKNTVDKKILGGIKLRYCGIQLDGSIKTRLESFENALKNILI